MPRRVEVFSAGCPCCDRAVAQVMGLLSSPTELVVQDMHEERVASRARDLGIERVPAVVIDGKLADCCKQGHINAAALRENGLGSAA